MKNVIHPDAMLHRVRSRGIIVAVERKLKQAKYRREHLSDDEISAMLQQKAFYIGRQVKNEPNPFENWDREDAEQLANSYRIGSS